MKIKNKRILKSFFECFLFVRKLVYISLGKFDDFFGRENKVVVYCYHSIDNHKWIFSNSRLDLERQMELVSKTRKAITLSKICKELSAEETIDEASFAITFDDGYEDIKDSSEIFRRLKINPSVFLIGDRKKIDRKSLGIDKKLLDKRSVKNLIKNGWEIGSHGMTHKNLMRLNKTELEREIIGSKRKLETQLSIPIHFFSYPNGAYDERIVAAVKLAGYKLAVSMDDKIFGLKTNPYLIPRIGVNGTHTDKEFKYLASPSVVWFRGMAKKTFLGSLI